MPRQFGPIKLQGTIGDITFVKNEDGTFGARAKTEISKERIATDPAFIRTRENNVLFGRAGKGSRLFREAFQSITAMGDRRMIPRLQQLFMRVIKTDTTSARGEHKISLGNLLFLEDFNFNANGKLNTVFKNPFVVGVDRATGVVDLNVPPYIPEGTVFPPTGATHYKLFAVAAEVDFDNELHITATGSGAFLPLNNVLTSALSLSLTLTPNSTLPIFTVLAIRFYQDDNNVKYALNNSATDAVAVVNVDL